MLLYVIIIKKTASNFLMPFFYKEKRPIKIGRFVIKEFISFYGNEVRSDRSLVELFLLIQIQYHRGL